MVMTYHATVGANTVMELDFAIDRTGNVAPSHAALYAAFGAWRRACYGTPLSSARLAPGQASVTVALPDGATMDRVVLQEAQAAGTYGDCVANYTLEVEVGGGWLPFGRMGAHLVGNKRIELNGGGPGVLGPSLNATAVRFTVTRQFCPSDVTVSAFSPEPCVPKPPPPPKPVSRVRFRYSDGRCLVTNDTCVKFPCPLFLGDCAAATAVWDDRGDTPDDPVLVNLGVGAENVVNADCNRCTPHTVLKLESGSPASIVFSGGQLRYSCGGLPGLCISGGLQGPPNKPCGGEPVLAQQVQVDQCASAGTQGWTRQVQDE
jgi:hypothetical protein